MSTPILVTKLYTPSPHPDPIARPQLLSRLRDGLYRQLTLISAPAGFGKTTVAAAWLNSGQRPAAWLSLDEGDNDPARFLTYFVAALQTVAPQIGQWLLTALQMPQPPSSEAILTSLVNEIAAIPHDFILALDDYHLIESEPVNQVITFLLDYPPPRMHLVLLTREDPPLPLARLRARGQLTELRAADLRFTLPEAAVFLNETMGLNLTADEIAALENRTEGWIAGLQLAALALQGAQTTPDGPDAAQFIQSFTGSHRFILDYLMTEVWRRQPEDAQTFLLRTAILERVCASLGDAVVGDGTTSATEILAYLERANLFVVSLDNERRWYRYHHLFADLLRQRLGQLDRSEIAELHRRASVWYETEGLELEAFRHAAVAGDIARAERLLAGQGMPLIFRGGARPALNWLDSLPTAVLDVHPYLWATYANAPLFLGQVVGVEERLQAAEAALKGVELDEQTRDLIGYIATTRAAVAVTQSQAETILTQSRRALDYLHPRNLPMRTATIWTLGYAHQLQGDRTAAAQAYSEAIGISQEIGHFIILLMSTLGLGHIQEIQNQLHLAAETYRRVLELAGDPPLPTACDAYLGLARIAYAWNDLAAAQRYAEMCAPLARQIEKTDRLALCELFLVRLKLAQGELTAAATLAARLAHEACRQRFDHLLPEITAAQVEILLRQGHPTAAAELAQSQPIPFSQAKVELGQGNPAVALTILEARREEMAAKGWQDEWLKTLVLLAAAYEAQGERETAVNRLLEALVAAEPSGAIRLFTDEGEPAARLLAAVAAQGIMPDYTAKLLAAWEAETKKRDASGASGAFGAPQPLVEPLSQRELEILRLIAQGLSNGEIGERLFLALDTIKGHNRRIFGKLQVQRRTEAVARARELGLLE